MARSNPIDEAFSRIALLKAIVSAERTRAEAEPFSERNYKLGVVDPDGSRDSVLARASIREAFNALALFLDHLTILHMAASFEFAAGARIGNALGVARTAVDKTRKPGERWPTRMLREADDYESLKSIESLLTLPADDMDRLRLIRRVRNELGHGVPVTGAPTITGEDARAVLIEALAFLKV